MRRKVIIALLSIILLLVLYASFISYKKNNNINKKKIVVENTYIPEYLSHANKCYSCERQLLDQCGESCVWKGQKTKSFDSERELVGRSGNPNMGYIAKTIKYY